jgi:hypothetical protein
MRLAPRPAHVAPIMFPVDRRQALDRLWAAVRKLVVFDCTDIWREARVNEKMACHYLTGLERAGYVEMTEKGDGIRHRKFRLLHDIGVTPPQVNKDGKPKKYNCQWCQIWRAVRILRQFSAEDVLAAASTRKCKITQQYIHQRLAWLANEGYLIKTRERARGVSVRYRAVPSKCASPTPPQLAGGYRKAAA